MYLVNRGIGQIDVFMYNITWLACACLACFGCSGLCSLQLGPTIYTQASMANMRSGRYKCSPQEHGEAIASVACPHTSIIPNICTYRMFIRCHFKHYLILVN